MQCACLSSVKVQTTCKRAITREVSSTQRFVSHSASCSKHAAVLIPMNSDHKSVNFILLALYYNSIISSLLRCTCVSVVRTKIASDSSYSVLDPALQGYVNVTTSTS